MPHPPGAEPTKEVLASQPFEFTGLENTTPGEYIYAVPKMSQARKIAHNCKVRNELRPDEETAALSHAATSSLFQKHDSSSDAGADLDEDPTSEDEDEEEEIEAIERPQLRIILKADVHGSLEAIQHQLNSELEASLLDDEEVLCSHDLLEVVMGLCSSELLSNENQSERVHVLEVMVFRWL
jgi:translation initiation factor IF-2